MPQTNMSAAKARARAFGYEVRASLKRGKKLDVYKNGDKVASIGDIRYQDFLTHKDTRRRRLYHARHKGYAPGTAGWLAKKILW